MAKYTTHKRYKIYKSIQELINSKKGQIDQETLNEASELLMEKYENFISLLRIYIGNTTLFSQMKMQQISSRKFTELIKEVMNNEEMKDEIGEALMDLHESLEAIRNLYTGKFNYDVLLEDSQGKLYQGSFSFEELRDYGLIQFSKTGRMSLEVMEEQLDKMILGGNVSEFTPFGKSITKTEFLSTMASKLGMHKREDLLATKTSETGEVTYKNFNAGWAYQWYRAVQSGVNYRYLSYENLTGYAGADTKAGQEKVGSYGFNPIAGVGSSKVGITGLFNQLVSARSYLSYIPQVEDAQNQLFSPLTNFNGSDQALYQTVIDQIMAPLLNGSFWL